MSNGSDKNTKLTLPVLGALAFVCVAWLLNLHLLIGVKTRGTFGDMFGGVNALFSGLAFVGVFFAIVLQSKELKLQREELESTREELKGQKKQLEAQSTTLRKQNFENTFFELLRIQNDIVNSIDLVGKNTVTRGRDCFKVFYQRFKELWDINKLANQGENELGRINKTYLDFFEEYQSEIGHYFRTMYNIFKFVDKSSTEDKRLYTNIVRAQLSSFELALLFYNALSDAGSEKFKPLIEQYSLLKTVPKELLLKAEAHSELYNENAYGNQAT